MGAEVISPARRATPTTDSTPFGSLSSPVKKDRTKSYRLTGSARIALPVMVACIHTVSRTSLNVPGSRSNALTTPTNLPPSSFSTGTTCSVTCLPSRSTVTSAPDSPVAWMASTTWSQEETCAPSQATMRSPASKPASIAGLVVEPSAGITSSILLEGA